MTTEKFSDTFQGNSQIPKIFEYYYFLEQIIFILVPELIFLILQRIDLLSNLNPQILKAKRLSLTQNQIIPSENPVVKQPSMEHNISSDL